MDARLDVLFVSHLSDGLRKVDGRGLADLMAQARRDRGNVIGEYPRVKAGPRQRDIGEPAVDEVGMGGMIYVHQHTVRRQSLGTVAGDGVTMIEVMYRLGIEGERLPGVHLHCHHSRFDLLYRSQSAVGDMQLPVGCRELNSVTN